MPIQDFRITKNLYEDDTIRVLFRINESHYLEPMSRKIWAEFIHEVREGRIQAARITITENTNRELFLRLREYILKKDLEYRR